MGIVASTPEMIQLAAGLLKQGELVAFPTETVYGLGADAANSEAVAAIFKVKGRPANHPVIVHVGNLDSLEFWARDISHTAFQLAQSFWPGPLTLILRRTDRVPDRVTGGQETLGLRIPSHPVALQLLKVFGGGVAAPSANHFGRISPTTAQHVQAELGQLVPLILDGGASQVGLESTIIDVTKDKVRILRPGGIDVLAIAEVVGYMPELVSKPEVRVSGNLESHYAPATPMYLVSPSELTTVPEGCGVLTFGRSPDNAGVWVQMPQQAEVYGQRLYAVLRDLDSLGLDCILVEHVPDAPQWLAVRDRLRRASSGVKKGMPEFKNKMV